VKEKQQLMKLSSIGCCSSSFLAEEPEPKARVRAGFLGMMIFELYKPELSRGL
jgi:hypothetical protein